MSCEYPLLYGTLGASSIAMILNHPKNPWGTSFLPLFCIQTVIEAGLTFIINVHHSQHLTFKRNNKIPCTDY